MPQLPLPGQAIPCELQLTYRTDPTSPDTDPVLSVAVRDLSGLTLAWQAVHVPLSLLGDSVEDIIRMAWRDYLYTNPRVTADEFRRRGADWRALARRRKRGV